MRLLTACDDNQNQTQCGSPDLSMGNIIFEFPASYAQRVAFGLVVGTLPKYPISAHSENQRYIPIPSSKSIANIFGYQTRASTESNWALMGPVAMIKAITPGGKNCFHIWTQQWVSIFVINKFEIIINVTGNLDTKLHHLIFNQSEFRAAWKSTKLPHDWIAFMNLLNIISFSGQKRYILNIYNSIFYI